MDLLINLGQQQQQQQPSSRMSSCVSVCPSEAQQRPPSSSSCSQSGGGTGSINKKTISSKSKGTSDLRQGKWTREEEDYVQCLMEEFKAGTIPLAEGTSLRTFLSKMLRCDPMRISKKFVGSQYNGKQIYVPASKTDCGNRFSQEQVRARRAQLCELERRFLAKIGVEGGGASNSNSGEASPALLPAPVTNITTTGSNGMIMTSDIPLKLPTASLPLTAAAMTHKEDGGGISSSRNISVGDNLFKSFLATHGRAGSTGRSSLEHRVVDHADQKAFSTNRRAADAGRAMLLGGTSSSTKRQVQKPLSSFTSAELAAELQKRSALLASTNTTSTSSNPVDDATDLTGWLDRQNSIDSLSNLIVVRSALKSLKSLGNLLDPISGSTFNLFAGPAAATSSGLQRNWMPSESSYTSSSADRRRRGGGGINSGTLANLQASLAAAQGNSGLNLASLIHAGGDSSSSGGLQGWNLGANNRIMSGRSLSSDGLEQSGNTALARFLQQEDEQRDSVDPSTSRMAHESNIPSMIAALNKQSSSSSGNDFGVMMETLKRKYLSQEGLAAGVNEEHRRTKLFR